MSRRRIWRGKPLPQRLSTLIDEGALTLDGARRIADVMAAERSIKARQEREHAERIRAWQERQAEEARMAKPWAEFIMAHMPAMVDAVIHRDFPIREAFRFVKQETGCDLGCGHKPLTAQQWAAFIDAVQEAEDGVA